MYQTLRLSDLVKAFQELSSNAVFDPVIYFDLGDIYRDGSVGLFIEAHDVEGEDIEIELSDTKPCVPRKDLKKLRSAMVSALTLSLQPSKNEKDV